MIKVNLEKEREQDFLAIRKLIKAIQHRFLGYPWPYLDMPVTPFTISVLADDAAEALLNLEKDEV